MTLLQRFIKFLSCSRMNHLKFVAGIVCYRIAYDLCYYFIFPSHEYNGIKFEISGFNYAITLISIVLIPYLINLSKRVPPSKIFILTYIFLFLIPLSSYCALASESIIFYLWCYVFIILLGIMTSKPLVIHSQTSYVFVLTRVIPFILILIAFLIVFFANGVPSLTALNFLNVYSVRSEFNSSPLIEYISSSSIYFALPVMVTMSIVNKKNFLAFCLCLIWTWLFLSSGGRLTFIFLLITIYICIAVRFVRIENALPIAFAISILISIAEMVLVDTAIFAHFGFYRSLLVPSWLSFEYFNFYDVREKLFFSEQLPSLFNNSINEVNSALDVGAYLFGDTSRTWANVGIMGYAFANLSYLGILEVLIFVPILRILDGSYLNLRYSYERQALCVYIAIISMYAHSTNVYNLLATRTLFIGTLFFILLGIYRSHFLVHERQIRANL